MKVRVINWGLIYSTYDKWFVENNCSEYLEQYHQENRLVKIQSFGDTFYAFDENNTLLDTHNIVYKVLTLAPHERSEWGMLYAIEEPITKKVYLIGEKGLEFLD